MYKWPVSFSRSKLLWAIFGPNMAVRSCMQLDGFVTFERSSDMHDWDYTRLV